MKSVLIHLILVLTMVGCAATQTPPTAPVMKERTYQSDFDTTWQAVVKVLNDRQLPVTVAEKDRGVMATDFVVAKMDQLSALFPPTSSDFAKQGRYKLNISVTPVGDQTRVNIDAHFERFSLTTDDRLLGQRLPTWKPQKSAGVLEPEIFNAIQAALSHSTDLNK